MRSSPSGSGERQSRGVGYAIAAVVIAVAFGMIVFNATGRRRAATKNPTEPTSESPSRLPLSKIEIRPTPTDSAISSQRRRSGLSTDAPKSEVTQMVEQYESEVAALRRDVAAYRESLTGIEEFRNVFLWEAAPFVLNNVPSSLHGLREKFGENGLSRESMSTSYGKNGLAVWSNIFQISVALYGNIPSMAFNLLQSGTTKLDEAKTSALLVQCQRAMDVAAELSPSTFGSIEYTNPFPEGTRKAFLFQRDVGIAVSNLCNALCTVYFDLPPALAERERHVRQLYKQICQVVPGWEELGREYVDPDQEMMRAFEEAKRDLVTGKTKEQQREEDEKHRVEARHQRIEAIKRKLLGESNK